MKLVIVLTNIPDNVECERLDDTLAAVAALTECGYSSTHLNDDDAEAVPKEWKVESTQWLEPKTVEAYSYYEALGKLMAQYHGLNFRAIEDVVEVK